MTTTSYPKLSSQKTLFGHPVGLFVLFFTELWERFSYYGMRALFTIFLVAETNDKNPGFGWTNEEAIWLYGWYTMLVYVAAIPGGWVADNLLGQKKTVMLGGLLLCLGHGILAFDSEVSFYIGCAFIILGVGGLKPNISSMVGGLYPKGDERRDLGFYIFYLGINLGAFFAPLLCGWVGETYNWHYGFGLAAIGMAIGQITYYYGQPYLEGVGDLAFSNSEEKKQLKEKKLTPIQKDRVKVLLISFLMIIIFWGAFEQAGGLMNLYAKQKTDRMLMGFEIPASWFQSLNAFFIVTLAVVVGGIWMRIKTKGKEASSIFKIAVGILVMGFGFMFMRFAASEYELIGHSSMYWLVLAYLFHTLGELCASPVSLSYITKLAPVKYASLIMGVYWAATGLGNKLAATIGENAGAAGEKATFTGIFVFCTLFALLIMAILKPLKRLAHGAEDLNQ
ncbi:MAG: peptide MFS transporter [Flavobacteriaceae bacterium]|jgi:POT family proton-dependent oligopeptide transporter|nr:peptide MFS transporter [Flavobacteriaceae bacterium]